MASQLTPNTNTLNSGAYLPVAEFLKRCDQNTVGDLCADNKTRVTPSALLTDPNLAAALLDASGLFEAAVTAGERYAPADIANILALSGATKPATVPNAGQGLIYRVLTALTEVLLWERRPDKGKPPERLGWVEGFLQQLASGGRVLPFLEAQAAGLATDVVETDVDVENRNLSTVQASRLFGRRGNRLPPGSGGAPAAGGWPWCGP